MPGQIKCSNEAESQTISLLEHCHEKSGDQKFIRFVGNRAVEGFMSPRFSTELPGSLKKRFSDGTTNPGLILALFEKNKYFLCHSTARHPDPGALKKWLERTSGSRMSFKPIYKGCREKYCPV